MSASVKKAGTPGPTFGPGRGEIAPEQERDLGRVARHVADPGDPARVGLPLAFAASIACLSDFSFLAASGSEANFRLMDVDLGVDCLLMSLPPRQLVARSRDHHAIVRLEPVLEVERRIKDRLELVVLFLSDWLELVVVALGTLERQSQERRADDLDRPLEHGVLVGADLVGVAVALAGAVLAVAQEMGRDELVDDRGRGVPAATIARQLIAGQLFADDLVERPIGVERANDVVAIAIGQRPVGIGAEVAVGIRVSRRIQPVLAPALAVAWRGEQTFNEPGVGIRIGVVEERRDLLGSRRQARQVEAEAADQRCAVGVGTEGRALDPRAPSG